MTTSATIAKTAGRPDRLCWQDLASPTMAAFISVLVNYGGTFVLVFQAAQLAQLTLARFIADGHFAAHVRAMRKIYAVRRDAMAQAVRQHLSHVVTAQLPPGGLQMPCLLHEGRVELDTIRLAAQAGIVLPGMSRLYARPPPRGGWLLGFAALTPHEIDSGIARLARALG